MISSGLPFEAESSDSWAVVDGEWVFVASTLLRDAKLYKVRAGTSEIRRMLIGRELFAETV